MAHYPNDLQRKVRMLRSKRNQKKEYKFLHTFREVPIIALPFKHSSIAQSLRASDC